MRNVIIIGSGPAGLTAAIYTARANLQPLVLEGLQPGGQLTTTTEIENFPGFTDGIEGPALMDIMRAQAERFGSENHYSIVDEVDLSSWPFSVTFDGKTEKTKSIILATGASARMLGLEGEARLVGRGLSTCATCDGFFFRDKEIAVVGGGDSALEEANFLTRFARKVTVIHRRAELRASKIMQDRARRNPKIEFLWNKVPVAYLADQDGALSGLTLRDTVAGTTADYAFDGVFLGIGHTPNTAFLNGQVALDDAGYVRTGVGAAETATSVPGVFAAGDVADHRYRQAITAAGMGCKAALDVEHYLEALDDAPATP